MQHTKGLVLLTIYISYTASEYIISSDGWIPITSDHVYNPVNLIHGPLESNTLASNTIKIIKTQNDQEKESKLHKTKFNTVANPSLDLNTSVKMDEKTRYEYTESTYNPTESPRKAKHIDWHDDKNDYSFGNVTIKIYDDVLKEDKNNRKITTYEVEEDVSDDQVAEQENVLEDFGYDYSPTTPQNLNFSSTLINILSKYNIKTDDQLPNYSLSRKRKVKNPLISERSYSPRVSNLYRYNSLNHLPVDPLLAVFLSNYGFYIPSLYGIKSNYNNLYGYLASNNVHNNKPFGLYKIFSDTDSWN